MRETEDARRDLGHWILSVSRDSAMGGEEKRRLGRPYPKILKGSK
jgi:hypothetical protein